MRTIETQLAEIMRRQSRYQARRQARRLSALGAALGALLAALVAAAPAVKGGVAPRVGPALGATILGPEAGGYVLVALVAFVLGIVAALAIQKYRQSSPTRPGGEGDKEDT